MNKKKINVLFVEDMEEDFLRLVNELYHGGFEPETQRVETKETFTAALAETPWDMVISDFNLPEFSGPEALEALKNTGLDIPFIIVSGTVGEEAAVDSLRAGAKDFIAKTKLDRFLPAVNRELSELLSRREKQLMHQKLEINEGKFRTLFEESKDAIFMSSTDGGLVYFNQSMAELLQMDWGKLFNCSVNDFFVSDEDYTRFQQQLRENGFVRDFEVELIRENQSKLTCLVNATIEKDFNENVLGYQAILHDISKQKHLERLNAALSKISRSVDFKQDLTVLIKTIQQNIHEFLDTSNFYIGIYDDETETISVPYFHDEYDKIKSVPAAGSLSGYVIRTGKSLFADTGKIEELRDKGLIEIIGTIAKQWIGVPVKTSNSTIGIIAVQSYSDKIVYHIDDMNLLEYVANELSHLIEIKVMKMDRDRMIRELQEVNEFSRTLFNSSLDMIIAVDMDRNIIEFNKAAERTFGYTREEVIGQPVQILYDDEEQGKEINQIAVKTGGGLTEVTNRRKDGRIFPARLASSPMLDSNGKVVGIMGISRDITEEKTRQNALIRSEEQHRAIVETAKDAIITINTRGEVVDWNMSARVMFGYLKEEIMQKSLLLIIPPRYRDNHVSGLERVSAGGESRILGKTVELKGLHKDGSEIPIEFSLTAWESGEGKFYTAIIRDISEKKLNEHSLKKALKDAKQGEKIKSLFLANISHEIRTPLNSILGYTDLLREMLTDKVGEEEREFFDVIERSGQRLIRTVHEILDMSQLDTKSYNLDIREFDLRVLVNQVISELHSRFEEKSLFIEVSAKTRQSIISADEYCITQAVSNIVENAIKYTKQGGIKIFIDKKDQNLRLIIQDTGIGISKEYQSHLFEIFSQETQGYSRKYEGLGLGLALTKRYLEANNATISIDSKQGKGTTVTIIFPEGEAIK